jgi:hypothetical protein
MAINGLAKEDWLQIVRMGIAILLSAGEITMFTNRPENIAFNGRLFTAILAGKIIIWRQ